MKTKSTSYKCKRITYHRGNSVALISFGDDSAKSDEVADINTWNNDITQAEDGTCCGWVIYRDVRHDKLDRCIKLCGHSHHYTLASLGKLLTIEDPEDIVKEKKREEKNSRYEFVETQGLEEEETH